jgi:hypothetical protein
MRLKRRSGWFEQVSRRSVCLVPPRHEEGRPNRWHVAPSAWYMTGQFGKNHRQTIVPLRVSKEAIA